jgi:hypothetical protein
MYAKEDVILPCACSIAAVAIIATYGWVELYKYWKYRLRNKSLSSIRQKAHLLFWVLNTAALSFCSIAIIAFIGIWIVWFVLDR